MSNPLLVGVDVYRKSNTVCLMDCQGQEVGPRFTVDNNRPGTATFIQRVAQQVVAGHFDAIHIAAEATGWYWYHLFRTLDQDPFLNRWPLKLYPFNPPYGGQPPSDGQLQAHLCGPGSLRPH